MNDLFRPEYPDSLLDKRAKAVIVAVHKYLRHMGKKAPTRVAVTRKQWQALESALDKHERSPSEFGCGGAELYPHE